MPSSLRRARTMRFSFLLDGQYVADSVKLEALNGFMMVQSAPEETEKTSEAGAES